MPLTDFIDVLPEDKREAFKAEISKAVYIASDADAEKFAESNEFLRKANQKYRDPKIQEFKDKFLKEDVPKLLEAERAKGQKSPLELKIEEMEKREAEKDRAYALEKQKNRALAKAQEAGIPAALIDKFVGLTDEETDAGLQLLIDTIVPLKKAEREAAYKELGGRQPNPQGGSSGKKLSDMTMTELNEYAKLGPVQQAEVIALAKQKR